MTETEHDREDLLRAVGTKGPIGIRKLARWVGLPARQVAHDINVLEKAGRLVVEHPTRGYRAGERVVRLP